MIGIELLEVLEGHLPRRALSLVLDWAELHRTELLADWELCRTKQPPSRSRLWSESMHWNVVYVQHLSPLELMVRFQDGTEGKVRFESSHLSGVFEALKAPEIFQQVRVESGAVTWPGDIDLAPDAMYQEIKRNGEWVLR